LTFPLLGDLKFPTMAVANTSTTELNASRFCGCPLLRSL
jgi:hypothetical protein